MYGGILSARRENFHSWRERIASGGEEERHQEEISIRNLHSHLIRTLCVSASTLSVWFSSSVNPFNARGEELMPPPVPRQCCFCCRYYCFFVALSLLNYYYSESILFIASSCTWIACAKSLSSSLCLSLSLSLLLSVDLGFLLPLPPSPTSHVARSARKWNRSYIYWLKWMRWCRWNHRVLRFSDVNRFSAKNASASPCHHYFIHRQVTAQCSQVIRKLLVIKLPLISCFAYTKSTAARCAFMVHRSAFTCLGRVRHPISPCI